MDCEQEKYILDECTRERFWWNLKLKLNPKVKNNLDADIKI